MTLSELMPSFGKFYCKKTCGIDGSALYANRVYPIAVDKEKNRIREKYYTLDRKTPTYIVAREEIKSGIEIPKHKEV